jgi:WD40 repeat protein
MRRTQCAMPVALALSACWADGSAAEQAKVQETGSAIAYVTPSRGESEVRLAAPDGNTIHTLFKVPKGTHPDNGVDSLAWSPDGKRLAFSSSHDWARSLNMSDIYVIPRTGGTPRRPTSPPDPADYDRYRKGKVKVTIQSVAIQSSEMSVFIEGATKAEDFTGIKGMTYTVTFDDVADLGEGVRQYVRLFRTPASSFGACWGDLGVFADVEAGKTVDAGSLTWSNRINCTRAFSPTWLDNETIAALFVEPYSGVSRRNNVLAFAADGAAGARGRRLVDWSQQATTNRLSAIYAGPKGAEQYLALLQPFATGSLVLLAPTQDYAQLTRATIAGCPKTICKIFGLAWRPDGKALFLSETQKAVTGPQPREAAVLYEADAVGTRREFLNLPNEVIGRIAVSPDGKTLAFERAKRVINTVDNVYFGDRAQCPCSIWLVDTDGSNLREFAADGRAPAWTR